jgi:hypothetical protein
MRRGFAIQDREQQRAENNKGDRMNQGAANGNITRVSRTRGQILSTDLVISLSLFLGAIMVFFISWSMLSYSYWESKADMDMQSAMLSISDALVLSPGSPADWEFGTVDGASSFGLANGKNELSRLKIASLQSFFANNYTLAKVGMGSGTFDIYVAVNRQDGTVLYSFGRIADFTDRQVVSASSERLAILDGELVDVKVSLWRTKGGAI